ncbi:MAG TPA: DUF4760 domain-containing protein [Rhizomicrobium sp.]
MNLILAWLDSLNSGAIALLGIIFATCGWLYAARRSRQLSRTQQSFNALLKTSLDPLYHENMGKIRASIGAGLFPDLNDKPVMTALMFILNYYEFISAGVRSGDLHEHILMVTERGTIVGLCNVVLPYIAEIQIKRKRPAAFENLTWLHQRWVTDKPGLWQQIVEWTIQRPLYRNEDRWWALFVLAGIATVLAVFFWLVPTVLPSATVPRAATHKPFGPTHGKLGAPRGIGRSAPSSKPTLP